MRHPFEIFCVPEEQKDDLLGPPSLAVLIHASTLQQQFKTPSIEISTHIEWMPPDMLSRNVISRSGTKTTYKFPSKKNNMHMHCESKHELNAMVILESRDEVISYQAQPAIISYQDALGNNRKHYPDILANITNGNKILIEIKSDDYVNCTETVWRTTHLHSELQALGIQYLLVAECQLRKSLPFIQLPLIGDF